MHSVSCSIAHAKCQQSGQTKLEHIFNCGNCVYMPVLIVQQVIHTSSDLWTTITVINMFCAQA
jgi:NADH:ubiquinone oxidoreductase subunit E